MSDPTTPTGPGDPQATPPQDSEPSRMQTPPTAPPTQIPPPPAPPQYATAESPAPARSNGLAIAALVVGVVAFLTGLIPWVGLLLGVAAVVLGVIALVKRQSKALSITGTALGAVAAITGLIVAIVFSAALVSAGSASSSQRSEDTAPALPSTEASSAPDEPAAPVNTAAAWADRTFGAFAASEYTGVGDTVLDLPAGVKGGMVSATHDGSSNFSISVLDAQNKSTGDLLVNTIGPYSGTTAWGLVSFGEGARLQVTADGGWKISIHPFSAAPAFTGAASGIGDAVLLYDGAAAALTATHDGARNFVVYEETSELFSMGLLVNTIGPYSGTVPLSAGPSILTVEADGAWSLTAP